MDAWRAIADPAERLATALDELYAFFERTEAMYTNLLRDETLVPAVAERLPQFRDQLDRAARVLAEGWDGPMLFAATRHAVDFLTWRSLARDGGVPRAGAVELVSAMVLRASAPTRGPGPCRAAPPARVRRA
jgi:hypothetical protein